VDEGRAQLAGVKNGEGFVEEGDLLARLFGIADGGEMGAHAFEDEMRAGGDGLRTHPVTLPATRLNASCSVDFQMGRAKTVCFFVAAASSRSTCHFSQTIGVRR